MGKSIKLKEKIEGTLEWARYRARVHASAQNMNQFVFKYPDSDFHTSMPITCKNLCDGETMVFVEEVEPDPEIAKRIEQEANGEIPEKDMKYVVRLQEGYLVM